MLLVCIFFLGLINLLKNLITNVLNKNNVFNVTVVTVAERLTAVLRVTGLNPAQKFLRLFVCERFNVCKRTNNTVIISSVCERLNKL